MKSLKLFFTAVLMLLCFQTNVFASSDEDYADEISLTGIDFENEEYTFDSEKTISAIFEPETEVNLLVYSTTASGNIHELVNDITVIGESGLYMQSFDLGIGENTVVLKYVYMDEEHELETTVVRKHDAIKFKLKQLQSDMTLHF